MAVVGSASALALDDARRTGVENHAVRACEFFSVFFSHSDGRKESIPARISANGEGVDFI